MSRGTRYYLHRGTIVSALVGTALLIISATTPHFYVGDRSAWTYIDKQEDSSPTHESSTMSLEDLPMSPLPYTHQVNVQMRRPASESPIIAFWNDY
uniref:Transmembrane protein n=1 Tax=Bursaphelenchus xylophilus TaxID=6326 RepID=A0A1I7S1C9_BURXY